MGHSGQVTITKALGTLKAKTHGFETSVHVEPSKPSKPRRKSETCTNLRDKKDDIRRALLYIPILPLLRGGGSS